MLTCMGLGTNGYCVKRANLVDVGKETESGHNPFSMIPFAGE